MTDDELINEIRSLVCTYSQDHIDTLSLLFVELRMRLNALREIEWMYRIWINEKIQS